MKANERSILDKGFIQGIGYACALLVDFIDEPTAAKDIIRESGISKKEFKLYCDEYDYKKI